MRAQDFTTMALVEYVEALGSGSLIWRIPVGEVTWITKDVELIAHLMRRASFGARRDELEAYAAKGYEATVEELLTTGDSRWVGDDMGRRFDNEASGMINAPGSARNWVYRMITTSTYYLKSA